MNILRKTLVFFAAISLLIGACTGHTVQVKPAEANQGPAISYQVVLGKSLHDKEAADFIAGHHCTPTNQFQLCKDAGMALWLDADQIVKTVYLYAGNSTGFRRYRGQLPYGLSFYDPMWRVEEILRALEIEDTSPPTLKAGLPDEGVSPDHFHYWAMYKRFGMTVIYNSPGKDEDAYIYAIVITE